MKKIIFLVAILVATVSFSQRIEKGGKQLNTGIFLNTDGIPFYIGVDYGVHEDITIGGQIDFYSKNKSTYLGFSANGNYHFNTILKIPNEWDVYAGLGLLYQTYSQKINGESTSGSNGPNLLAQIGGRYFFSDNLGVNLELGIAKYSPNKIGITYKF